MSKEFVTANQAKADKALERIATRVAEMIAPTIAEAVAKELQAQGVTTNGSNGRKIRADDLTSPAQGDEWDTLPPGDGWSSYDMNNPPGGEPKRNPFSPTGDDFDHLPVD